MTPSSSLSFSKLLRALVVATAATAIPAAGCSGFGGSCSTVPACKFVDLLAGCDAATGCIPSGSVEVSAGGSVPDPTLVQTHPPTIPPESAAAVMGPSSALSLRLPTDPTTLAAVSILDVVFEGSDGELDLTVDGESPCPPQSGPVADSVEWRCSLPAGAKLLELRTLDAKVTVTSVQLTEATCTGTAQRCEG